MAVYTYDEEADVLYVLLTAEDDPDIARTVELTETLHVDVNDDEQVVGWRSFTQREAVSISDRSKTVTVWN